MERAAGEVETIDKNNAAAKRKRPATDGASATAVGASDDILGTILARLPAGTAIACTALSKHHRSLIRSPEFRALHCRLGAPLPRPHVAYLAAAPPGRSSGYFGFHLAGAAGLRGRNGAGAAGPAPAPVRSIAGCRYHGREYVNTCNGVLLLASEGFSDPCRCTLWNPAVADVEREAPVPKPPSSESEKKGSVPIVLPGEEKKNSAVRTVLCNKKTRFLALGLGYGPRSNTYKLLLCRKDTSQISRTCPSVSGKQRCHITGGTTSHFEYSLVVLSLGGEGADMPLRNVHRSPLEVVLSYKGEVVQEIMERKSLYMDGTIYFLYWSKNEMLAFDVDDETVRTISMPAAERRKDNVQLIEMSDRPCLVIITAGVSIELWRLSTHHELERIHLISCKSNLYYQCRSIVGVWDCSGVLVLCFECSESGKLLLYDVAANKIFRANMPGDLEMEKSNHMICWGYKPTLVSPGSIVGELSQDMEQRRGRSAHITEVMNPLVQKDKRKGQKATLNTVCLMEFLVRIMQKLPRNMQDVVEMPSVDLGEPDLLFQNVV